MVQSEQIANCSVTTQDFKVAQHVLGANISSLKGKQTCHKPFLVVLELIKLPKELSFYKDVTLALDIVIVNKIPFLTTFGLKLQYQTCE